MKLLSVLSILGIFLLKCSNGLVQPGTENHEAYLVYSLPADGCSWHLLVKTEYESNTFAFDLTGHQSYIDSISTNRCPNGMCNIPVSVKYKTTGKTREVQCGWGKKLQMNEVEIVSIELRKEP